MSGSKPLWALYLATLVSAAGSMALEIAAGRMLAPYVGMSLYSWTAIIAVVLGGLTIGHALGGWLADRPRPGRALLIALAAAAAGALAAQHILRAVAAWAIALGPIEGVSAMATAGFFAPSVFAGMVSPLTAAMVVARTTPERRGRALGRLYALGALGAIAGVLASGLWLLPSFGTAATAAITGFAFLAMALLLVRGRAALAALIVLGAGMAATAWAAGPGPCLRESAYFCIRVDRFSSIRPARVLALDHLAHSVNDRDDPEYLHSPYVQLVDEIARRRFGDRRGVDAFFVGGGAYTLPRAWLSAWPEAKLTVAEIDPMVTEVAIEHLWLRLDSRLTILHRDGRVALQSLAKEPQFDVIFGDAFHDISIPQYLVTDEFHAEVAARLKPGGFYAVNVVEARREPPFLLSLGQTLRRRFEVVELWIWEGELSGEEGRATWIVVASDTATQADRRGPSVIAAHRPPANEWLRVPLERMLAFVESDLITDLTDDRAPVGPLMRHVLFDPDLAE